MAGKEGSLSGRPGGARRVAFRGLEAGAKPGVGETRQEQVQALPGPPACPQGQISRSAEAGWGRQPLSGSWEGPRGGELVRGRWFRRQASPPPPPRAGPQLRGAQLPLLSDEDPGERGCIQPRRGRSGRGDRTQLQEKDAGKTQFTVTNLFRKKSGRCENRNLMTVSLR